MSGIIREKANILIQIENNNENDIIKILKICEKLDYDIVFISLRNYRKYIRILERNPTNILVLRKVVVTGSRYIPQEYDMITAKAINRFVLNKLIRVLDIDSILVDIEHRDSIPSKDQLKIISEERKSIEIFLRIDKLKDVKYLKLLEIFLDYCRKRDVVFFFHIPIRDVYDLKNPYDVYSVLEILLDVDYRFINDLKRRQLQFISDMFYRRGLCVQLRS